MLDDIKLALLRLAWNARAPILSAEELQRLEVKP
nr:MAG TPA_asm: hypothetical protein [Caudoviricetes sp.]DAY20890.1 MAG TPA: hypothetical protein [Bacteriophage sp.]